MDSRECGNCSEGFLPAKHNQLYCLQLRRANCSFCGEGFEQICGKKPKQTCSKSCSSRLIRRQQAERNTANCLSCGESFQQKISAQSYCYRPLTVDCEGGCGTAVATTCSKSPRRFCTPSCRQIHMRATGYAMLPKDCEVCGEIFVPQSSKSLICGAEHLQNCEWCGDSFSVNIQSWREAERGLYCSNICSTLAQTDSKLPRELTAEYKAIDQWALRFREEQGRKPSGVDVLIYFKVGVPARADRSLFRGGIRRSGFESHVVRLIAESWPNLEILTNKRPLRRLDGRSMEIDIWLPQLAMGFEVQDFATHSRNSDTEKNRFTKAKFKCGPTYHKIKREAADRYGVEIFEIWEDDILEGRTQALLEAAIAPRIVALEGVSVP